MAKNDSRIIWVIIILIAALFLSKTPFFGSEMATVAITGDTPALRPMFELSFVDPPKTADEEEELSYTINVKNVGSAGQLYVDSGLYPKETIESWYGKPIDNLFALKTLVNEAQTCQPETFVQNKQVTLDAGQSTTVKFTIITPKIGTYYLHTGSFEQCWRQPGDEGYRTYRVSKYPVEIKTSSTTSTILFWSVIALGAALAAFIFLKKKKN